MKTLFEVWYGAKIYFNWSSGQFETEKGYTSYIQSSVRSAALKGW